MQVVNLRIILQDIADRFLIALDSTFDKLFYGLDPDLWNKTYHNPITFLRTYKKKHIDFDSYSFDIKHLIERYYLLANSKPKSESKKIAYISPEFGFHESFPNFAGGLGILAGDVIKTASTNGMDMLGIGLFYSKGYFNQYFDGHNQKETYKKLNIRNLPLRELKDKFGNPVIISLKIAKSDIYVKAYSMPILNSRVILLSTDLPQNGKLKCITEKLYIGDRYLRLLQEIVLGFGSVRVLEAAGIDVDIFHINEGHASFALWERAYYYSKNNNIELDQAIDILRSSNVFTTHTPVIHGNEEFNLTDLEKSLDGLVNDFGTIYKKFVSFGQTTSTDPAKFSMTVFGINLSERSNAVSKLHGETAALMWKSIYDSNQKIQAMNYVTNGVHIETWVSSHLRDIIGNIPSDIDLQNYIEKINPEIIFEIKKKMKSELYQSLKDLNLIDANLFFEQNDIEKFSNSLIICFARRFAEYKRPSLFMEIVKKSLSNEVNKDVNLIFLISGKSHPKDVEGKSEIQKVRIGISEYNLVNSVLFIPNYDINIGRILVQGSDVWLNNPIKPLEACGTSGMKAGMNLGINLSVDDGWWEEAYNGRNGFSVEDSSNYSDTINEFSNIISNNIIPMFSNAKNNARFEWVDYMKQSFLTSFSEFSSDRMLVDYLKKSY